MANIFGDNIFWKMKTLIGMSGRNVIVGVQCRVQRRRWPFAVNLRRFGGTFLGMA